MDVTSTRVFPDRSCLPGQDHEARRAGDSKRPWLAQLCWTTAQLDGVVEASYAFDRLPLLTRLGDDKVARIIDAQTLRFVRENFLEESG